MRSLLVRSSLIAAALLMSASAIDLGAVDAQPRRYRYRPARPHAGIYLFPRGLYFGAGIVGTKILNQRGGPDLLEDGAGLSLYAGLRVSRSLSLELGWVGTAHNPEGVETAFGPETDYLVLNGVTADARVYLNAAADERGAQPYLQGGLGVYFLDDQTLGTESVGTGFQLGGGLDFRVGRNLSLGVRALYRGIAMGPPESNLDDTFVSAITAEGNLSLRF